MKVHILAVLVYVACLSLLLPPCLSKHLRSEDQEIIESAYTEPDIEEEVLVMEDEMDANEIEELLGLSSLVSAIFDNVEPELKKNNQFAFAQTKSQDENTNKNENTENTKNNKNTLPENGSNSIKNNVLNLNNKNLNLNTLNSEDEISSLIEDSLENIYEELEELKDNFDNTIIRMHEGVADALWSTDGYAEYIEENQEELDLQILIQEEEILDLIQQEQSVLALDNQIDFITAYRALLAIHTLREELQFINHPAEFIYIH